MKNLLKLQATLIDSHCFILTHNMMMNYLAQNFKLFTGKWRWHHDLLKYSHLKLASVQVIEIIHF